ncbi:metal-sensing transcriptional repressor [Ideonella paludis]|jgi:DNA-binding FrmR family transcriptional regulator|uniref:Metal-sensing transcriptional repressor n=1 Tax=Ideonella paludis TaxID=1233411 RepID=A0ABS5DZ10_9BURK|nr:metal-sensing transcriptional repressor [Ideonella paludis]MBQ0936391.1 metal-sensing transcriptional repressor [Ideonella paludis]
MAVLQHEKSRTDLLNRLKRAEGQLRGIQRMIEGGETAFDIAGQMSAVRKALDSTYVRMTVCVMEQELAGKVNDNARGRKQLAEVMDEVQSLLSKVR